MSLTSRERRILISTSALHALIHMHMLTFAAVNIKMVESLGTGIAEIGFIATIGFFLFGFGALPAGWMIDRIGARTVLAICCAGLFLADCVLVLTNSVLVLTIGLALLGLSASLYHPAGLGLISRNISERGYAMGIHGLIGNIGVGVGPMIAGLIAATVHWRFAYAWPMLIMAGLTIYFLRTRFDDPDPEATASAAPAEGGFTRHLLLVMLLVIALQAVSGFIYRGSNTFMPAYMGTALANLLPMLDPVARGGIFTAIVLTSGAAGQYLAGSLTRKHSVEKLQVWFTILVAPLLLLTGMLNGLALLLVAMAFSFVFYGLQPLGNTLVAKYSPDVFRGRSYGLSFFLSFGLGAFGSGFAGYMGEEHGFASVYVWLGLLACGSIAIAVSVFMLTRKRLAGPVASTLK